MTTLTENFVLGKTRAVQLDAVRNLNLWGNDIKDVSILKRMSNLEVCSLSVNAIEDLAQFAECTSLTELYLRKNKISDLDQLGYLSGLKKLRVLWLCDNPVAELPSYRNRVLRCLPGLEKLDNKDVTPQERSAAQSLEAPDDSGQGIEPRYPSPSLSPTPISRTRNRPPSPTEAPPAIRGEGPVGYGRRKGGIKETETETSDLRTAPIDTAKPGLERNRDARRGPKSSQPKRPIWIRDGNLEVNTSIRSVAAPHETSSPESKNGLSPSSREPKHHVLLAVVTLLNELDAAELRVVKGEVEKALAGQKV